MYKPTKMCGVPSVVLRMHFKILDCKIRDALFPFYVCIIYVKSIRDLLQFSTI